MKKTIISLLTICCVLMTSIKTFGVGNAAIYSDNYISNSGEEMYIALRIQDNPGIMGFKLHLEYPQEKITLISSSKGDVTKSGNFSDNINAKLGETDILWNNTSQVETNGIVAIIKCKVITNDSFEIKLSYSQVDTFNEKYEDVILECSNIKFSSIDDGNEIETDKNGVLNETTSKLTNDSQIPTEIIITDVLENNDVSKLDNLSKETEEKLLDEINDKILNITDIQNETNNKERNGLYYSSYDDLITDYKSQLKEKMKEDVYALEIEQSAQDVVKNYLNENKLDDFSQKDVLYIVEEFEKEGLSDVYSKYLTEEELYDILHEIYADSNDSTQIDANKENISKSTINTELLIVAAIIVLVCIIVFALFRRRKKHV